MGLFDNIKGLTSINHEKEFGTHLMQLTEMALADKILTTSERTMLRNLASARKVDMKRFDEYVNSLIEKRGIKQINDGNLPLKKYSTAIPMANDLKNLIDMALADGYLSDEERKMILQEAKKLGFTTCVIPSVCLESVKEITGIRIIGVSHVGEAMDLI